MKKLNMRSNNKEKEMKGISELEEDKLSQMVRDFIELDCDTFQVDELVDHNPTNYLSLQDILGTVSDAETEILGKILFYWRNMVNNMEPKKLRQWIVNRLRMDEYEASLCKTSWITSGRASAFQFTGDYEYIDVMMKESNGSETVRLIVDIDFRSQFELARPTLDYQELLNSLPSIFVGTEEKLNGIISLLCSAAKQSLKEKGLHVPPWRKASYMHSKWLSNNCKKIALFAPLCI
ncbi:uncharacterized protein LOC132044188 isoform X1 [Lycium ferocissimum]|uniref:uncharacterized protein LOC132044188 isoform X1 n=1 Tax=Lycium ferocissimum TaxID=112874 RepID=UPI002816684E|nr:uncharacterized protein LOC132044188 isoform X1 [Lycium ferocissimum]